MRGEHDDGYLSAFTNAGDQLGRVCFEQSGVEQHDIRSSPRGDLQRGLPVRCDERVVSARGESLAQLANRLRFVIVPGTPKRTALRCTAPC